MTVTGALKSQTDGMLWSTVARVQSGRRTGRPAVRLAHLNQLESICEAGDRMICLQSLESLGASDLVNQVAVERSPESNIKNTVLHRTTRTGQCR